MLNFTTFSPFSVFSIYTESNFLNINVLGEYAKNILPYMKKTPTDITEFILGEFSTNWQKTISRYCPFNQVQFSTPQTWSYADRLSPFLVRPSLWLCPPRYCWPALARIFRGLVALLLYYSSTRPDTREDWIFRGPRSSSFCVPRNLLIIWIDKPAPAIQS